MRNVGQPWRDPFLLILVAVAALVVAALLASGGLPGAAAPDTAGYYSAAVSDSPWAHGRNPMYGWFVLALGGSDTDAGAVAIAQLAIHIVAGFVLYWGVRRGGISPAGSFALAAAMLASQSALLCIGLLIPEALAVALLVIAFALTLVASNSPHRASLIVPIALAAGLSYILRPTHLPAIVILPILYALFACRSGVRGWSLYAGVMAIALALPFLIQSSVRLRAVSDFNVTSYGGFQMSAMAGFMLAPEMIERFPEATRNTARDVLSARQKAEGDGTVARTPLNSSGERSFMSAALGYFDIYARSYDNLLHGPINGLRGLDESWVAFNHRLMAFSLDTVRIAPARWAAWVGGASARLVGRAIATNVTSLLALGVLAIALVASFASGAVAGRVQKDAAPVVIVAVAWLVATAPLTVVTTFPATRYIDTAAIFLPAVPLIFAIAIIQGLRARNAS